MQMVLSLSKKDFMELLLSREIDANDPGYDYTTPMLAAARSRHCDIAEIQEQTRIIFKEHGTGLPLQTAIANEDPTMMRLLMKHGADVNRKYTDINKLFKACDRALQLAA